MTNVGTLLTRGLSAVNDALETLVVLRQNVRKDSGKSTVLSSKAGVPDRGFPSLLGHCLPSHALNGRGD